MPAGKISLTANISFLGPARLDIFNPTPYKHPIVLLRSILMALTKIEMVKMLCDQLNLPKKEGTDIVESFLEIIKGELEKSNTVKISGFGNWVVRSKRERPGRNPQTGEEMTLDARKVVTFKTSKKLVGAMNPEKG